MDTKLVAYSGNPHISDQPYYHQVSSKKDLCILSLNVFFGCAWLSKQILSSFLKYLVFVIAMLYVLYEAGAHAFTASSMKFMYKVLNGYEVMFGLLELVSEISSTRDIRIIVTWISPHISFCKPWCNYDIKTAGFFKERHPNYYTYLLHGAESFLRS